MKSIIIRISLAFLCLWLSKEVWNPYLVFEFNRGTPQYYVINDGWPIPFSGNSSTKEVIEPYLLAINISLVIILALLIPGWKRHSRKESVPAAHWVTIANYRTREEAGINAGILENAGIRNMVMADDLGGAKPFPFSPSMGVLLQVPLEEKQKAIAVLE